MATEHAVIVGGSSGIGLATARRLLGDGLAVTILGRNEARLAKAKAELEGVGAIAVDATDRRRLEMVFAQLGQVEHLVLAFGSRKGVGPFSQVDIEDVRQGFEEKVFPQFQCAQIALPFVARAGSMTFVSAVSAYTAAPGTAGIGAANAAIAALVPILAAELKPIRVNGVAPRVIDTPWWDFLPEAQKLTAFEHYGAATPVGRIGKPEDVAGTIAFLVRNGFMTGQTIICDGGMSLSA